MFNMPGSRARPLPRQRDQIGYQLSASVTSGNNLVIGLNQVQGADPFLEFRDPTAANGGAYFRPIPSGAQFVINSGNTMGAANNTGFRLWILGFDNGGGISLGAINCSVGATAITQIVALDESVVQTTTGGNGGSTAGTFFCAQTLTSRPYRILGYMEWGSGLATAGTWNTKPTKIQLFGPGIKKPGEPVQTVRTINSTMTTGTSSTFMTTSTPASSQGDQYMTQAITPQATSNVVRVITSGMWSSTGTAGSGIVVALFQDSGTTSIATALERMPGTVSIPGSISLFYMATINTTSTTTFKTRAGNLNAAATVTFNGENGVQYFSATANSYMLIDEIMG